MLAAMLAPLALVAAACGGPGSVEVPAGTELSATLDQDLSTKQQGAGDAFTATVAADVSGPDGTVLIPKGATLHGQVTAVRDEGSSDEPAYIQVAFEDLAMRGASTPVTAEVTSVQLRRESETHDEAAKIGGGAAIGGLLGALVSGGDAGGTVAGAAVGAATGTAITLGTAHQHAYLARGSTIGVRLTEAAQVPAPGDDEQG